MPALPNFQVPRTGEFVAQIGQQLGSTIQSTVQQAAMMKQKEDLLTKAAELAEEDFGLAVSQVKGVKAAYKKQAKSLGLTDKEINFNLQNIQDPINADKGKMREYLVRINKNYEVLKKDLFVRADKLEASKQQQELGQFVGEQVSGRPGQPALPQEVSGQPQQVPAPTIGGSFAEQDITQRAQPEIPEIPKAETQADIQQAAQGQFTQKELETQPGFQSLPTEKAPQQTLEELKADNLRARTALTRIRKTKEIAAIKNAEKKVQQAEDRLKKGYNKDIGGLTTESTKIDREIKSLKSQIDELETGDPIDPEAGVDADEILELESQISSLNTQSENIKDDIQTLRDEKKMAGALPGETRKFAGGGKAAVQTPKAPPAVETPGQKQLTAQQLEAINWLRNNPNDPRAEGVRAKLQEQGAI